MSFSPRFLGAAVIACLTFSLGACSQETAAPDGDTTAPDPAPDQAPDKDASATTPADSTATAATESDEEKPQLPAKFFDLVRDGDRLLLSGRIRSELQARDIVASLQIEGLTLENKLEVDPKTPGVDWGNRIHEILPQLVMTVPDVHYHVEEGVITVKGTVKSEGDKNQLQRDIVYWMESPLIKDMKNELKIEGGGEGEAGGKGKGEGGGKGKGGGEGGGKGKGGGSE